MKTQNSIQFSVVVCCFNGQATIGRAIESLLAQDFPKDKYEILVVDDGSTDNTAEIVRKYPVKLISMIRNQGLSAARNNGLDRAAGKVYVGFDDDCIAEPSWLSELSKGYTLPNVAGVGGQIIMKSDTANIVSDYMYASKCGNPPDLAMNSSMSVYKRFFAYYREKLPRNSDTSSRPHKVRELNGANTSFPVSILRSVNGWDQALSGVEDTDLSKRIAVKYPEWDFYAIPTAHLTHDPGLSIRNYLRRFYLRGPVNLAYYRRYKLIPPIFPFPLLVLFALAAALVMRSSLLLLIVPALPLLLYIWWPIRAIREHTMQFMYFAYIQFFEELTILIGLLRGYFLRATK